jgi:hypothetical protein
MYLSDVIYAKWFKRCLRAEAISARCPTYVVNQRAICQIMKSNMTGIIQFSNSSHRIILTEVSVPIGWRFTFSMLTQAYFDAVVRMQRGRQPTCHDGMSQEPILPILRHRAVVSKIGKLNHNSWKINLIRIRVTVRFDWTFWTVRRRH